MAVRQPLYLDSGNNPKEMTTAMVTEIVNQVVYQYSVNPSVVLSIVGSGGTLGTITDTRLQAGAVSSRDGDGSVGDSGAGEFPDEATTEEPQTITVNYDKISSTNNSVTPTTDTGITFPVFSNSGNIQAMNLQDVKDTFLHPAIDLLSAGTTNTLQGGTYTIHNNSALAGGTLVSATPIFVDTKADLSSYTSGTIGDHAQDNPTTVTSYYLHRINGNNNSYTQPLHIRSDNNLQTFTNSTFESLLQGWIRKTAVSSSDGYSLSYNIGSSGLGNTRGTGISNTILNGSGDYQTRQVGDDYRAQEFPNGTPVSVSTYYLRVLKS